MHENLTHPTWGRRDPELRASDADREGFSERLHRHHADGRLTTEEFQERIDSCYSAKTVGELEQLVTDLPAERPREPRFPARRLWAVALVPIVIALFAVSAATGWHHGGGFWIVFPLFFMLRFMVWGPYRRPGWRHPGRQA